MPLGSDRSSNLINASNLRINHGDRCPTNLDGLAQVRVLLARGRQPPLGEKLGISLVEAEHGHAIFEATPDNTSYNPMGSVHGGYISTILDSACGIAAHTGLKPGFGYTTLELKVSFIRSLNDASGKIRAIGRLISMGGRAAFSEATLFNEKGQICATATSTLLVFELRPTKAPTDTV